MAHTVGELRRLLEQYPDSMSLAFCDDNVGFRVGIDVYEHGTLGLFDDGGNLRYYRGKPLWNPEWVRDEEVLILG